MNMYMFLENWSFALEEGKNQRKLRNKQKNCRRKTREFSLRKIREIDIRHPYCGSGAVPPLGPTHPCGYPRNKLPKLATSRTHYKHRNKQGIRE